MAAGASGRARRRALPRAYLTTIVTRLCIDHLRSAERTRMEYPGPWLPEPLAEPNQESAELASR